eukprot:134648-Rhodomonas_salina.5
MPAWPRRARAPRMCSLSLTCTQILGLDHKPALHRLRRSGAAHLQDGKHPGTICSSTRHAMRGRDRSGLCTAGGGMA